MEHEGFLRTAVGTGLAYLIVMFAWTLIKSVYVTLERRSEARKLQANRPVRR